MGLLNYLTATSLDEDYAHVAARNGASGTSAPATRGRMGLVVLAAFGILIATAGVQTARNSGQATASHDQLVRQVNERKSVLDSEQALVTQLKARVSSLQQANRAATAASNSIGSRLTELGVSSGGVPVRGPGVRVVVADAPGDGAGQQVLDKDLQTLVNGLWQVGAEAIAINGQRLTSLTSIRTAGEAITVNYRSLDEPYVVQAVGNKNQMPAAFLDTAAGQTWAALRADYGLQFEISPEDSMTLPAEKPLTLHVARAQGATS